MTTELKNLSGAYLPRVTAVFYAEFDSMVGPRVVEQVPEGSISTVLATFPTTQAEGPEAGQLNRVLLEFSTIADFVIPRPELCGHLVTKATRNAKVLGFPVCIMDDEKYHSRNALYNRNIFVFNLCFVFERDAEISVFEPMVRKTGRMLAALEQSTSLLSNPQPQALYNLLEQLYMDLNTFSETSIPLGDSALELMVFPFYANPQEVNYWDVPLSVVNLVELRHSSWDVTLYKITSYINGIHSIRKIAELAQVSPFLALQCIRHLIYYGALIMVDLFQFSNVYTPLDAITEIAQSSDEDAEEGVADLRAECEAYVFSGAGNQPQAPFAVLYHMYANLTAGKTVSQWIEENSIYRYPIDVRRMIQFGVIKGFLRRVFAYPVWLDHPSFKKTNSLAYSGSGPHISAADLVSSATPPSGSLQNSSGFFRDGITPGSESVPRRPRKGVPSFPHDLPRLLDGNHHTDEICIKYHMPLKHLERVLEYLGERTPQPAPGPDLHFISSSEVSDPFPTHPPHSASRQVPPPPPPSLPHEKKTHFGSRVVMVYV